MCVGDINTPPWLSEGVKLSLTYVLKDQVRIRVCIDKTENFPYSPFHLKRINSIKKDLLVNGQHVKTLEIHITLYS